MRKGAGQKSALAQRAYLALLAPRWSAGRRRVQASTMCPSMVEAASSAPCCTTSAESAAGGSYHDQRARCTVSLDIDPCGEANEPLRRFICDALVAGEFHLECRSCVGGLHDRVVSRSPAQLRQVELIPASGCAYIRKSRTSGTSLGFAFSPLRIRLLRECEWSFPWSTRSTPNSEDVAGAQVELARVVQSVRLPPFDRG